MQAVGRRDTDIERRLRHELWRAGFRYRISARTAETRPDLVFPASRVAVFIDGCFWHGCPEHYRAPVGNATFWRAKLERNQARDRRDDDALRASGWHPIRLWGCRIRHDLPRVVQEVTRSLRRRRR
jgi:DNA mismatch endonuclease (patch repair protein)